MLSKAYGWTPQQIGELTLPQVLMYLSQGDCHMGGPRQFGSIREALESR